MLSRQNIVGFKILKMPIMVFQNDWFTFYSWYVLAQACVARDWSWCWLTTWCAYSARHFTERPSLAFEDGFLQWHETCEKCHMCFCYSWTRTGGQTCMFAGLCTQWHAARATRCSHISHEHTLYIHRKHMSARPGMHLNPVWAADVDGGGAHPFGYVTRLKCRY